MIRRSAPLALLGLIIALIVAGCGKTADASTGEEALFSQAEVTRGDMADVVEAYGQVAAIESRELAFETVSGSVAEVLCHTGQQVAAGDALVRLDTTDLERQLREAQADLIVAEAVLSEAESSATPGQVLRLEAELSSAEQALAEAEMALAVAEARGTRPYQAKVEETAAAVQAARDALAMTELTASASEIRKLEYDEAFFLRAVRDAQSDEERAEAQEALDDTLRALAAARLARESALRSAQDAVTSAQEDYDEARQQLARVTSGEEDPAAEKRLAYEQAQLALQKAQDALAQAQRGPDPVTLEAAQTTYDAALAKVEGLVESIDAATLVAPFAGVVFDLYVQPGQFAPMGQKVAYLADPKGLRLEARVSEVDVVRLQPGQEARVRLDAFPGDLLGGEIETVSPRGEAAGGIMAFKVEVSMEETTLDIRPGMTALIRVVVGERQNVVRVPSAALNQAPDGSMHVEVRTGTDTWEDREVEIGYNDGLMAEVIRGLQEGDVVRMPLQEPAQQNPWGAPIELPTAEPSEGEAEPAPAEGGEEMPPAEEAPPDGESVPPAEEGAEPTAPAAPEARPADGGAPSAAPTFDTSGASSVAPAKPAEGGPVPTAQVN